MQYFAASPKPNFSIGVAHNDIIVSFTVGDEVVYIIIDILHFLIVVAGSR